MSVIPRGPATIVINWHGPLSSLEQASRAAKDGEVEEAIYLAVNKKDEAYAGISKSPATRLTDWHHVLGKLGPSDADLWIGVLASQKIWTASDAQHSSAIKLAEHMTIYFLELSENQNLRKNPPGRSVILLNRWYEAEQPYKRRPDRGHKDWPDLIEFDKENHTSYRVWFGGRLETRPI